MVYFSYDPEPSSAQKPGRILMMRGMIQVVFTSEFHYTRTPWKCQNLSGASNQ
jgi:hypothetical protein